jgi:hypothetical protein
MLQLLFYNVTNTGLLVVREVETSFVNEDFSLRLQTMRKPPPFISLASYLLVFPKLS